MNAYQRSIINDNNILLATDSYKLNHWNQYPPGTETVYSYLESRSGAAHPYTVFFGLQYIIKKFLLKGFSWEDLSEAGSLAHAHFGDNTKFNYRGWVALKERYKGYLPLRIKAVPEGMIVPTGNVLMTIENTDPDFPWLTNYMESLLLHVWYPTTVATRSRATKEMFTDYLNQTADGNLDGLPYMLHDFGYRGVSTQESSAIGGAAHLVNFVGTDTLPAITCVHKYYNAEYADIAYSVPATEHSIMTAMGEDGEHSVIDRLLDEYPTGILSVVNDSYNYQRHVDWLCTDFRERILAREGVFVTRPDSKPTGMTPADVVVDIARRLWKAFGGETNVQGNKVLDSHVRILWGDGIESDGIELILRALALHGFSAENMVFGMGGGLLQKVNRDTENLSIKSSHQVRNGVGHDIYKSAPGKVSKAGRLALIQTNGILLTMAEATQQAYGHVNLLETVFEDGRLVRDMSFAEIRANAAKPLPV